MADFTQQDDGALLIDGQIARVGLTADERTALGQTLRDVINASPVDPTTFAPETLTALEEMFKKYSAANQLGLDPVPTSPAETDTTATPTAPAPTTTEQPIPVMVMPRQEPYHQPEPGEFYHVNWFDYGFRMPNGPTRGDNGEVKSWIIPDPELMFNYILRNQIVTWGNTDATNTGQRWLDWNVVKGVGEWWGRFYLKIPRVKVTNWWAYYDMKNDTNVVTYTLNIGTNPDGSLYPFLWDGIAGKVVQALKPQSGAYLKPDVWQEHRYHYVRNTGTAGKFEYWIDDQQVYALANVKTALNWTGFGIGPCNYGSMVAPIDPATKQPNARLPVQLDFGPMTFASSPLVAKAPYQVYGWA